MRDNFSQFYEQLGCVYIMQVQGHIQNNQQLNGFLDICDFVKEKVNAF
jgi:hypothetical protein